jgi:uncharacterized protein (TIRG00374 family)
VILLIALLLIVVDVGRVIELLLLADWRWMLLGIGFLLLGYGLLSVRMRYLLGGRVGFRDTFRADTSGMMLTILMQLPNSVYRPLVMDRTTDVEMAQATPAVMMEVVFAQILRVVGLVLFILLATADTREAQGLLPFAGAIVVLLLVVLFVLASRGEQIAPRMTGGLRRLPRVDKVRAQRLSSMLIAGVATVGSPRRFGVVLFLSLAYWLCGLAFYSMVLHAFDLDPSVSDLTPALVVLFLVPPSTPLMAGLFHGIVVAPLVALGLLEAEIATAYAVLLHAIQMVILITLGMWGLSRLDINLGEILSETRQRIRGKPDGDGEEQTA